MREFSKPSRKPVDEPPGLDAFATRVPGAVLALVDATVAAAAPVAATAPVTLPEPEREELGMNVRFTATEKATLERLAAHEDRSQHQILKRLLRPVLLAAAQKLDAEQ